MKLSLIKYPIAGGGGLTPNLQQVLTEGNVATDPIYLNTTPFTAQSVQFFGDSITEGIDSSSNANRWTTILSDLLGVTEINNGVGGTVLEKRVPIDPYGQSPNGVDASVNIVAYTTAYKYLIFAYGVNDVGWNSTNYTPANFQTDYTTIINAAIAKGWPTSKIVILSTYYLSPGAYSGYASTTGTPIADITRSLAFNTAAQAAATSFGAIYIDIYDAQANSDANGFFVGNALHPQDDGHRFIAQYVFSQLGGVTYQNGQLLAVNGAVELSTLQLSDLSVYTDPLSVLVLNYDGNVGMADPNGYIRNNLSETIPNVGNINLYGHGYFGGVITPTAIEQVQVAGGFKTDFARISGGLPGGLTGQSMEMALLSATGLIFAYDRDANTGLNLNLGFGFSPFVIVGANTVTGTLPFQVNSGQYISGSLGVGESSPTALIHTKPGTAAPNDGQLKLSIDSAPKTTPETGLFEFDGTNLFFTIGGVRKTFTLV